MQLLAEADGASVSGEAMSRDLHISRAGVAQAVEALRSMGYDIESAPRRGHRLVGRAQMLLPFEVQDGLTTRWAGRHVIHHQVISSTQALARTLAIQGAEHGTLVIAEQQTEGKGRMGRAFVSPPGGLWCTLIARSAIPSGMTPLLGLAAGAAVARAVIEATGLKPILKWPNDLLFPPHKVAGVLIEVASEDQVVNHVLIGLGLNANTRTRDYPPSLDAPVTSLLEELGHPVDRRKLLQAYLAEFEKQIECLEQGDAKSVIRSWTDCPSILGMQVQAQLWDQTWVRGVATALDDSGALLVRKTDGSLYSLMSGSLRLLPRVLEQQREPAP